MSPRAVFSAFGFADPALAPDQKEPGQKEQQGDAGGDAVEARLMRLLREAGLLGAGISVDSLDPEKHDAFRGLPGAWQRIIAGIENCRRLGLDFQLHFSISTMNKDELDGVIDFARASGARVLNVFFLVCTGRGEEVTDLSPEEYERAIRNLIEAQSRVDDLIIRTRCAPYFKRIAHQLRPETPLNRISGREGDGCIAGIHYCRVTPEGSVTACPYIDEEVGSVLGVGEACVTRSAAAEQRLIRVPRFLQRMVRRRAEAYAMELGASEVLAEHLEMLAARRFGGRPPSPPGTGSQGIDADGRGERRCDEREGSRKPG